MFVTEKMIYLQLQKTGSTHIARILNDLIGGKQLKKHSRIRSNKIPTDKLIIGSIRNPWEWYLSLWAFGCQNMGGLHQRLINKRYTVLYKLSHPLQSVLSFFNEFNKPIDEWKKLYKTNNSPPLFQQWLEWVFLMLTERLILKKNLVFHQLDKYTKRKIKVVYVLRNPEQIILSSMEKGGKSFIYSFQRINWLYDFMVNCKFELLPFVSERIKKDGKRLINFCELTPARIDYRSIKTLKSRKPVYLKFRFANFFWKRLCRFFEVFKLTNV